MDKQRVKCPGLLVIRNIEKRYACKVMFANSNEAPVRVDNHTRLRTTYNALALNRSIFHCSVVMDVGKVTLLFFFLVVSASLYVEIWKFQTEDKVQKTSTGNATCNNLTTNNEAGYIFTCKNIESIKILRYIGEGFFKRAYLGQYGSAKTKVVIKMLTNKTLNRRVADHFDRRNMFMKEILILQQLNHPNIIKLLGFCFRSKRYGSGSLKDEGLMAVLEYGERVKKNTLGRLPLSRRLDIALDVLDLLTYLENSPLGSLRMRDLLLRHFLLHDKTLKLIDVDGDRDEPRCSNGTFVGGKPTIKTCQCVESRCVGYNAYYNLRRVIKILLCNLVTHADVTRLKQKRCGFKAAQRGGIHAMEILVALLNNTMIVKREELSTRLRQLILDSRSVL